MTDVLKEARRELDALAEYVHYRDRLLQALDVDGMIALLQRQHVHVGHPDRASVLRGMHKARLMLESMSESQRAISRAWLIERGETIPPGAIPARH